MRYLCLLLIIMLAVVDHAWGNSCYSKALPFQTVVPDRPSIIRLEARRVKSIENNTMIYDLGGKTIRVKADSFVAGRFVNDVAAGRCAGSVTVRLTPERESPFNEVFKATRTDAP